MSFRHRIDPWLLAACVLSAPLFLYGLGNTYLWQDEAQTALLGESVLRHGVPLTGEGSESVSAHGGQESGLWGLHLQISWLQAYLAAASMAVLGHTAFAARLPFAVLGWLTVPLTYAFVLQIGGCRFAARLAAWLLAFNLMFLLYSRQARYYALAAFAVALCALAFARLWREAQTGPETPMPISFSVAFGLACIFLVLAFDLSAVGMFGATAFLWVLAAWRKRSGAFVTNGRFWAPWAAGAMALGGWLLLATTAVSRGHIGDDLRGMLTHSPAYFLGQVNGHVVPLPLLGAVFAIELLRRRWWRLATRDEPAGLSIPPLVCVLVLAAGIAGAACLPPGRYPRYLLPAVPLLLAATAIGLAGASRFRGGKTIAVLLAASMVLSTLPFHLAQRGMAQVAEALPGIRSRHPAEEIRFPLLELLGELQDPPGGPVAVIIDHLEESGGTSEDTIVTTYSDLPLKFHTSLKVFGGETGALPPPDTLPRWLWARPIDCDRWMEPSFEYVEAKLETDEYEPIPVEVPARQWENRAAPHEHVFTDVGGSDRVDAALFERRRSSGRATSADSVESSAHHP